MLKENPEMGTLPSPALYIICVFKGTETVVFEIDCLTTLDRAYDRVKITGTHIYT